MRDVPPDSVDHECDHGHMPHDRLIRCDCWGAGLRTVVLELTEAEAEANRAVLRAVLEAGDTEHLGADKELVRQLFLRVDEGLEEAA